MLLEHTEIEDCWSLFLLFNFDFVRDIESTFSCTLIVFALQYLIMQAFLSLPEPPFEGKSKHILHSKQLDARQPVHSSHLVPRRFLTLMLEGKTDLVETGINGSDGPGETEAGISEVNKPGEGVIGELGGGNRVGTDDIVWDWLIPQFTHTHNCNNTHFLQCNDIQKCQNIPTKNVRIFINNFKSS